MTIHKALYPRQDIDRLHVSRKDEGDSEALNITWMDYPNYTMTDDQPEYKKRIHGDLRKNPSTNTGCEKHKRKKVMII